MQRRSVVCTYFVSMSAKLTILAVENNLPTFLTEDQLSSDVDKYYAKYNGKYVEVSTTRYHTSHGANLSQVNDYLIGNCVCPADLLQFPCRWDEFWQGCQMLRLCSVTRSNSTPAARADKKTAGLSSHQLHLPRR